MNTCQNAAPWQPERLMLSVWIVQTLSPDGSNSQSDRPKLSVRTVQTGNHSRPDVQSQPSWCPITAVTIPISPLWDTTSCQIGATLMACHSSWRQSRPLSLWACNKRHRAVRFPLWRLCCQTAWWFGSGNNWRWILPIPVSRHDALPSVEFTQYKNPKCQSGMLLPCAKVQNCIFQHPLFAKKWMLEDTIIRFW